MFRSWSTSRAVEPRPPDATAKPESDAAVVARKLERIVAVLAMDAGSDQEYLDRVLEEAIAITESRIGYIYHYDEDTEEFILNSWSRSAMSQCEVQAPRTVYQLRQTGLWGEAVRRRAPVVTNDFDSAPERRGLPSGHVPLRRFLTIPVFVDGRIVGVVGVANKERDYDDLDTRLLEVLMSAVWKSLQRRKAEKMEALGMLAGGIAHDFNNILGAIQGFAELSHEMVEPDSPVGENLSRIVRASRRARNLVERIQLYRRSSEPRRTPVLLGTLVEEVVEQIRSVAAPGVAIECGIDRAAVVEVEPTQIHEVFLNLGMNALNAMDGTGRLSIRMHRHHADAQRIARIGTVEPGWQIAVEFADTGCGMDETTQRKAFDPFFTTRRVGEGNGLGLSVVQGILLAHGCALDMESRAGQGSVFRVWLPLSSAEVRAKDVSEPPPSEGAGGRILVADDEAVLRDFYRQTLIRRGYEVLCAESGDEALDALCANPDAFDLLLTDQTMPGMSGLDLARSVRSIAPDLPILMCTGHEPDPEAPGAGTSGVSRILSKPVEMSLLVRTVGEMLEAGRKRD